MPETNDPFIISSSAILEEKNKFSLQNEIITFRYSYAKIQAGQGLFAPNEY